MFVLITYDIRDNKRRNKVYKTLLNHGISVQLSVFECDLNDKQLSDLRFTLNSLIVDGVDDLNFYFLCNSCSKKITNKKGLNEKLKKIII